MDPEKPPSAEIVQPLWSSWASAGLLSEGKSAQLFCVSSSEEFILGIWSSVDSSVDVCVTQNGIHLHPLALQVKWSEKQQKLISTSGVTIVLKNER